MSVQENMKKFCQNVQRRRREMGITPAELARRSGLPLEMLESLERGIIPEEMSIDDAYRLKQIFGCKMCELFE